MGSSCCKSDDRCMSPDCENEKYLDHSYCKICLSLRTCQETINLLNNRPSIKTNQNNQSNISASPRTSQTYQTSQQSNASNTASISNSSNTSNTSNISNSSNSHSSGYYTNTVNNNNNQIVSVQNQTSINSSNNRPIVKGFKFGLGLGMAKKFLNRN